jgi:integrase
LGVNLGAALGAAVSASPVVRSLELPPYVVLRGSEPVAYYKRRVPPELRAALDRSTFTKRLEGHPGRGQRERTRFHASYARAHAHAEEQLEAVRQGPRRLSHVEQLGVAGQWARSAGPQHPDPTDRTEVVAILQALVDLGVALPCPVPAGWLPGPIDHPQLTAVAHRLAERLDQLEHPAEAPRPTGGLLWGEVTPAAAIRFLTDCVQGASEALTDWLQAAHQELKRLGVVVGADQVMQVAARLAATSAALGAQVREVEAGKIPPPLAFPDPPAPNSGRLTLADALDRWTALRQPTFKTQQDAAARLQELALHTGHDQLDQLTAEQVADWRSALLAELSVPTVKRRLALVRAVLGVAAADGLPVAAAAIERLGTSALRAPSGTSRQRRPFTQQEAALLWTVSRQQQGRPLDRWAIPLGLSLGCRLEELAGLRPSDVRQIDGQWVVVIEPSEDRRLKNNTSTRTIPLPDALLREGFATWAQQQGEGLLFPEPAPPAKDPRLSHYASIRLGKLIRKQAGISDPAAVFHSGRHFTAQQLVDAGAPQRVIEQLLGHSSRSMTARYSRDGVPLAQLAAAMESRDWSWVP